jgi:hypothetical protein
MMTKRMKTKKMAKVRTARTVTMATMVSTAGAPLMETATMIARRKTMTRRRGRRPGIQTQQNRSVGM